MGRVLISWLSAVFVCVGAPAAAHPHVFVDAQAGFAFDDEGRLEALRITWTYDALTTLFMFDTLDLDKDRDGVLNDADRAAIAEGETTWPPEYNGDIHLDVGGTAIPMARPINARGWMENDQISVTFDLPLQEPLEIRESVTLRLFDPYYYYAYAMVGSTDVATGGCAAEIIPFQPDAATAELQLQLAALSREEMPEQENVGALFADRVVLTCD